LIADIEQFLPVAIFKMAVEIFQCWESIRDIIIYPHIKFWWYRTMLNFCGIVVAILKMATGRNCSMSGINSGQNFYRLPFSKWPPQYRKNSTLFNFNDISYVGRLWCPVFIPDIEKFLTLTIFKNGCHNRESIRDIIIYPYIKFWWYRKMLNFYRRHCENGRHFENFENAELLL
jgi:hypothetical protein